MFRDLLTMVMQPFKKFEELLPRIGLALEEQPQRQRWHGAYFELNHCYGHSRQPHSHQIWQEEGLQ